MEKSYKEIQSVVESYGDMLYRLALHYVKSHADAEDVVQETLLAFLTHSVPKEREKAWLLKVVVNKSMDILRRRKRHAPFEEDVAAPLSAVSLSEELEKLSALDREIVYLFYYEGYTSKEVATLVNKSEAAVRKRLQRAKAQLKILIEE